MLSHACASHSCMSEEALFLISSLKPGRSLVHLAIHTQLQVLASRRVSCLDSSNCYHALPHTYVSRSPSSLRHTRTHTHKSQRFVFFILAMEDARESAWIGSLKCGGAVPLREVDGCANGWSSPSGDIFQVRGPNYLESKTKTKGGECLLKPIAFDWIKCSNKIFNVMQHPDGRVRAALDGALKEAEKKQERKPFVWAINLQVPSKENHSLIFYYVTYEQPQKDSLLQRFLDGSNSFRNSRFKLLANVVQGPWVVKTAVGERAVCLLGKAVTCTYTRTDHFMEIDVDIGASIMANAIVHLAFGYVTSLTVDLAFVIEGQVQNELPEKILGTIRFANLDPAAASILDVPLSSRDKMRPNKLWRSFSNLLHGGHNESVANVEEDERSHEVEDFVHSH